MENVVHLKTEAQLERELQQTRQQVIESFEQALNVRYREPPPRGAFHTDYFQGLHLSYFDHKFRFKGFAFDGYYWVLVTQPYRRDIKPGTTFLATAPRDNKSLFGVVLPDRFKWYSPDATPIAWVLPEYAYKLAQFFETPSTLHLLKADT